MIERMNVNIEAADHTEGTFKGFVYFSECPAGVLDALRLGSLDDETPIEIEGTFEIEFDDGWPIGLSEVRLYLIRSYRDQFFNLHESKIEVFAYDLIEGGDATLEEKVVGVLDLDGAAADYAAAQIDSVMHLLEDE